MPRSAARFCGWLVGWPILLAAVVGFSNGAAGAPAPPNPHEVSVASKSQWTNTGIQVRAGDTVIVGATGTVEFRGPENKVGPEGVPWGTPCRTRESKATVNAPWPVSGVACWALIGRIGTGRPFEVGRSADVHANNTGQLELGINDNYIADNAGSWRVTVTVTSASASPNGSATTKHDSSALVDVIIGLIAVGVIVGLVALARKSRRRHARDREAMTLAAAAAAARRASDETAAVSLVPTDDEHTVVPGEHDATKTNIFEVELTTDALRVGYNQFPQGIPVEWTVRDGRVPLAQGSFVTNGGGETEHYVSFPVELPATADGQTMTVHFRWTIEDVPFTYAVQRAPRVRPSPVE
jgi:hypothetical protein